MSKSKRSNRNVRLKLQYRAIMAYWGMTLAVIGATMLFPLLVLPAWPEEIRHAVHFVVPAAALIAGGTWLYHRWRPTESVLTLHGGGLIVVSTWAAACLASTWPLIALEHLTFTQALFECVSGWTTTGLSVVDVVAAEHLTLLWRSTMQLVGGAGFAIIMLAALTSPLGVGVTPAEGRTDQLVPHVRESAKLVLLTYAAYIVVGVAAHWLAGMTWFDAVNHSFAALSTGGFSTRPESIGYWDSPVIEAITIALMIFGNLNFLTAYVLWRGRLLAATRDGEVRVMALVIPAASLLLFLFVCRQLYPAFAKAIRVAIFETVTAVTTTGFSTVGYGEWNGFGFLLLIVVMLMGGGTGSIAGGLKQFRVYVLTKAVIWEVRRWLLPRSAVVENYVWRSGERDYVDDPRLRQTSVFAFLYIGTFLAGAAILTAHGIPLPEAMFEFASSQGTVGLSVGVTGPKAPALVLWTEIAGMFLGRLEFLIVLSSLLKLARDLPNLAPAR